MNQFFAASTLFLATCAAACSVAQTDTEAAAQANTTAGQAVQVVETAAGKVLADLQGLSLYTFDRDTTTESTCYNACATAWPPMFAPEGQALAAPLAVTTRTDGKKQITLNGHPLYHYSGDGAQGDINGEGLGNVWHLARPVPPKVTQVVETSAGKVLADLQGLSLYTFDRDTTTESTCYNACATAWPPMFAPEGQALAAPFAVTTRTDGKKQITLNGHPLYHYVGDEVQGDINGEGLGNVWHLARPVPPKVTQVVETSEGKVLADLQGLSLYTFDSDTTTESTCYNACATAWPPLFAPEAEELAAPFAVTTRTDGKKQVTLNGHPLYHYVGDEAQGDINGDGIGGVWHLARPAAE